ncbi:universal stress protein [Streptomyces sp. NPDC059696]|uniref:universal stress protein n=1 Tax=Streptomyces sp. NPDC059696 TaxID=3346911 RepID=UPI0036847D81
MSTLPVVAAVDGSDDSLRALEWAVDAARRRAAPLRVAHVRQYAHWAHSDMLAAVQADPGDDPVLDRVRAHLAGRGDLPDTEYVGLEGAVGAVLPGLGAGAQLLVLGSRGRGGFAGLLLGSTGMAAARDAECPVVVVPRPGRETSGEAPGGPGSRVVVGLKADGPDEATLAFAFAEAARRDARLQAVAAYPWPAQPWMMPAEMPPPVVDQDVIEDETRVLADGFLAPFRERHPEVPVELLPSAGDAAGHLVAASLDADLVVVGRHQRRLLSPVRMMGSVTHAVLLHAVSPVAVVPPSPSDS